MHLRCEISCHNYRVLCIFLIYLYQSKSVHCSGYFNLHVLQLRQFGAKTENVVCPLAFHLCLKEHQVTPLGVGACSYGNATVVPDKSGYHSDKQDILGNVSITVNFDYSWPEAFTLVLELTCMNESSAPPPPGGVVDRVLLSQYLSPSHGALQVSFTGERFQGVFTVSVTCAPHYFSDSCSKLCRPRHDKFGHYKCDSSGEKVCMTGWVGDNCQTAVCRQGCDVSHGTCVRPGECRCAFGWQGELCTECIPYPGCVHGGCRGSPWQCICELNWGGILCDKDLNPCGREVYPCQNGGVCENVQPNQYRCVCPEGFTGKECQHSVESCVTQGCGRHGDCDTSGALSVCRCHHGWTGAFCLQEVNECSVSPCERGACTDLIGGFLCTCDVGWTGLSCDQDVDECAAGPCVHAVACHNYMGGYVCECTQGWGGHNCHINLNECEPDSCLNGGVCVDMVAGFYCSCPPGFRGDHCELVTDPCDSEPCQHGGRCEGDAGGGVRCGCTHGYTGPLCEVSLAPCSSNPCQNGGSCVTLTSGYHCVCLPQYMGEECGVIANTSPLPSGTCTHRGEIHRDGGRWTEHCNTCRCEGGTVRCSQVVCGPQNCVSHPHETFPSFHCPRDEQCLPDDNMACLTPPCLPWGVCDGHPTLPTPPHHTDCPPDTCTQLTVIMEASRLPQGLWLESVCREIRNQSVVLETGWLCEVLVTCSVVSRGDRLHLKVTLVLGTEITTGMSDITQQLVVSLSTVGNRSLYGAVVTVTAQPIGTHRLEYSGSGSPLLLALLLTFTLLLSALSLTLLLLCYRRRARLAKSSSQHQALLTSTTVATVTKSHDSIHHATRPTRATVSRHNNPMYRQDIKDGSENIDLMSCEGETCHQENVFNQWRDVNTSAKLRGLKQESEHHVKKGAKTEQKERVYRGEYSLDISRTERYILEV